jgi:Ser/Thr protein kinase RdoA (MazF antagonist)
MKFLKVEPPLLPPEAVAAHLRRVYGLKGELKPLEGERDQNFRLRLADGECWTVKVTNLDEPREIIECQVGALKHILAIDPGLPVPSPRPALDGRDITAIRDETGREHPFHVLSYLPGEIVAGRRLGQETLGDVGAMLARLGLALRGYFHPALGGRGLLWDGREAPRLRELYASCPRRRTRAAGSVLDEFKTTRFLGWRHSGRRPFAATCILQPPDRWGCGSQDHRLATQFAGPLIQDLGNVIGDFLFSGEIRARPSRR